MGKFKVGDIVRFASAWCSEGEEKYIHVVKENMLNPVTGEMTRYLIETINMEHMKFHPTEVVEDYMIEPSVFNAEELKLN